MGYRTVVMLSNDHANEWENDPNLGKKIAHASSYSNTGSRKSRVGPYGMVVECVHADTQTLAVLDGYTNLIQLAYKGWATNETDKEIARRLLKDAADILGYRLVKKRSESKP